MAQPFKYLIFISFFIGIMERNLPAQEIPIYYHSQYLFNPYLINPAIAGSKDFTTITLSARQNLAKIAGAPKTQMLSGHSRIRSYINLKKETKATGNEFSNIGVGGYLYNDASGPLRKIGFQATYAYHIPLSRDAISHLAFGISFSGFVYSISYGDLNILRDPLIDEGTQKDFVPDANIGIYYYDKRFFAGLSSSQIFETPINWKNDSYENIPINRNYFLFAGLRFLIVQNLIIEPSIMLKTNDSQISEFYKHFDINAKVYYASFIIGASYRMNEGVAVLGQYQYRNFFFGLAYEYPFSDIWNYNFGTAEVVLGFNLGLGKNRFGDSRYW